jgi:hypothetical protein
MGGIGSVFVVFEREEVFLLVEGGAGTPGALIEGVFK